jgi:hypothetical protein
MFPIVSFLVRQILGIVGSQIEIERIFLKLTYSPTLEDVFYNKKIGEIYFR